MWPAVRGCPLPRFRRRSNQYPDVNELTRERIRDIAREMGYTANPIASTLVRKSSSMIGLVMSSWTRDSRTGFMNEVLSGVYEGITTQGYEVMILPVDTQKQRKKSFSRLIREYHLAGVIIQGLRTDDPYYIEVTRSERPCVLIDMPADGTRFGCVMSDNRTASREAVLYLISLGHRCIAHIAGTSQAWVSSIRKDGYKAALADRGIPYNPALVIDGMYSENAAYSAAGKLLREHPEITAVFSASDVMAMGVFRAAKEVGRRVGEDLAVVGFDDVVWASLVSPSLTTVRQDFHRMGFKAAEMLHALVSGSGEGTSALIPHELVIRESSGSEDLTSNHRLL